MLLFVLVLIVYFSDAADDRTEALIQERFERGGPVTALDPL